MPSGPPAAGSGATGAGRRPGLTMRRAVVARVEADALPPPSARLPVPARIGVISDTHALVRDAALAALADADLIVHAGDVMGTHVLAQLRAIAPVVAVRGNNDPFAAQAACAAHDALPDAAVVQAGDHRLLVLHAAADLALSPAACGLAAVITGHSHRPAIDWRDGVLHLNPGSAGPRRFALPVTVAWLEAGAAGLQARIVELG